VGDFKRTNHSNGVFGKQHSLGQKLQKDFGSPANLRAYPKNNPHEIC
jgi:hypothetical protein